MTSFCGADVGGRGRKGARLLERGGRHTSGLGDFEVGGVLFFLSRCETNAEAGTTGFGDAAKNTESGVETTRTGSFSKMLGLPGSRTVRDECANPQTSPHLARGGFSRVPRASYDHPREKVGQRRSTAFEKGLA